MSEHAAAQPAAGGRAVTGRRPGALPLLLRQVRYQNRLFLRNPFSAFFSLAFPLMFLLLFGSLNGGQRIAAQGGIRYAQFLTPGMLAFAVISTCYTNLAVTVAINRDEGLLKRVRGTPLPSWIYIASRILSAVWFALVAAVIMVAAGVLLFHVKLIGHLLPAAVVSLLLGAICFCALGIAIAALVPNGESAPVFANFTLFPILFISAVFFPIDTAPTWLRQIANFFPIRHFAGWIEATFNPLTNGGGFQTKDLLSLLVWTAVGMLVAVRRFQWEPRTAAGTAGRRRLSRRA
jgi:ABC-2 type transport system permease protein